MRESCSQKDVLDFGHAKANLRYDMRESLSSRVLPSFPPRDRVKKHLQAGPNTEVVEDMVYVTCGQGMPWAGYQSAMCITPTLRMGAVALLNAGTHAYEANNIVARAIQQASTARYGEVCWFGTSGVGGGSCSACESDMGGMARCVGSGESG